MTVHRFKTPLGAIVETSDDVAGRVPAEWVKVEPEADKPKRSTRKKSEPKPDED